MDSYHRPCLVGFASSQLITEFRPQWARTAIEWETAWEILLVLTLFWDFYAPLWEEESVWVTGNPHRWKNIILLPIPRIAFISIPSSIYRYQWGAKLTLERLYCGSLRAVMAGTSKGLHFKIVATKATDIRVANINVIFTLARKQQQRQRQRPWDIRSRLFCHGRFICQPPQTNIGRCNQVF